jgi:hypothetical protein
MLPGRHKVRSVFEITEEIAAYKIKIQYNKSGKWSTPPKTISAIPILPTARN